jgi:hypothetical protein
MEPNVDKQTLLAAGRLDTDDVPLPGLGAVKVRGLARGEVLELRAADGTAAEQECRYVAKALLDPVMTEDEVALWQKVAKNNEFTAVVGAIYRLSGFGDDAPKSGVPEVRE